MDSKFEVALTRCYFCCQGNEIVVNTLLIERAAAEVKKLHDKVINMQPCPKCEELMKKGVILLTFDESKSSPGWEKARMPNPYRTGGFFVVKDSLVERAFDHPEAVKFALEKRWLFIQHEVAVQLGLFRLAEERKAEGKQSG